MQLPYIGKIFNSRINIIQQSTSLVGITSTIWMDIVVELELKRIYPFISLLFVVSVYMLPRIKNRLSVFVFKQRRFL